MRFCRFFIVFDSLYRFYVKSSQRAKYGRWQGAAIIGYKGSFYINEFCDICTCRIVFYRYNNKCEANHA